MGLAQTSAALVNTAPVDTATVTASFEHQGFVILDDIVNSSMLHLLQQKVETTIFAKAGTRNLLNHDWCATLARQIKQHPQIDALLPNQAKAVQSTYFNKSPNNNWLVSTHRDQFIPVKQRIKHPRWTAWSEKEGVTFARPPIDVLNQLVVVRLHLEDNNTENGPLKVIPQSHHVNSLTPQSDQQTQATGKKNVSCIIKQGGALVMKPLLLHASEKSKRGERRVIHFLFGPAQLPHGAQWHQAV